MQKDELKNKIESVVDGGLYAPSLYALLSVDGGYVVKRIRISEILENRIKEICDNWLNLEFFCEGYDLNDISYIDENKKIFYGIDGYYELGPDLHPKIKFPRLNPSTVYFSEADQKDLIGFLVYINKDDECFWLYQHRYKMTRLNRLVSLFAYFDGTDTYKPVETDIFRIEHKFDFVITNDFLATKNWKLLQQNFGFENYVRSLASQYIDGIEHMGFIADMRKLRECGIDFKITKKIIKLKNSKVLQMKREDLLSRIANHSYYGSRFPTEPANGNILVPTKKAVVELLKMLNDDILHSELTLVDYESLSKSDISDH